MTRGGGEMGLALRVSSRTPTLSLSLSHDFVLPKSDLVSFLKNYDLQRLREYLKKVDLVRQ